MSLRLTLSHVNRTLRITRNSAEDSILAKGYVGAEGYPEYEFEIVNNAGENQTFRGSVELEVQIAGDSEASSTIVLDASKERASSVLGTVHYYPPDYFASADNEDEETRTRFAFVRAEGHLLVSVRVKRDVLHWVWEQCSVGGKLSLSAKITSRAFTLEYTGHTTRWDIRTHKEAEVADIELVVVRQPYRKRAAGLR